MRVATVALSLRSCVAAAMVRQFGIAAQAKRLSEITWYQLQTKGEGSSPRSGHTITVDPKTNKAVLFGRCGINAAGESTVFNETWLLTTQEPMAWENADVSMGDVPTCPRPAGWCHTATMLPGFVMLRLLV